MGSKERRERRERAQLAASASGPRRGTRRTLTIAVGCYVLGVAAAVPVHAWSRRGAPPAEPSSGTAAQPAPAAATQRAKAEQLLAAERFSEALAELNEAVRLDPSDAKAWNAIGEVHRKMKLEAEAEVAFRRAYELAPDDQKARDNLAMVLHDTGQHAKAEEHLRKALERRPEDTFLWAELALNRIKLGRAAEAIPLLQRYNERQGKTGWGLSNLGRAYAEAGQRETAEAAYRAALRLDPRLANTYLWLGQLLVTGDKKEEGAKLLETYQRLRQLQTEEQQLEMMTLRGQEDWRVLANLGRVRFLLGKLDAALGPVERAMQLAPQDDKLPLLRQDILQALERQRAAAGTSR